MTEQKDQAVRTGRVRPAEERDADPVRRLMEELESEKYDPAPFCGRFRRFHEDRKHIALVYDDNGVIGFFQPDGKKRCIVKEFARKYLISA